MKDLRDYAHRGAAEILWAALMTVLVVLVSVVTKSWAPFFCAYPAVLSLLPSALRQRRMNESEWRRYRSEENDERMLQIRGRAALYTVYGVTAALYLACIAVALTMSDNPGYTPILKTLLITALVMNVSYMIIRAVLEKRS